MSTDTRRVSGVYFLRKDYAGFWRRLFVDAIDLAVAALACVAVAALILREGPMNKQVLDIMLAACAVIFFCYFVALKRSRFRTLGYRACGVRIIGIDGGLPNWSSLTLRLLFIFLGALNYLCDLLFASGDENRQSIRDKFTSTYVVKAKAQTAGTGLVVYQHYNILGLALMFREVERGKAPTKE
jgi:uncharacterized RDD family membrane protein YckC